MKKLFYLLIMAIALVTSCSKSEEPVKNNGAEDLKIKFGSITKGIDVKTRAPINTGGDITDIQLIRVDDHTVAAANWSTAWLAATASCSEVDHTTAKQLTVVGAQYYNANSNMYSTFTAYAPAATFTTTTTTTATWTIDGKTDILVSSSAVSGNKTNSGTALNFGFEHKLLQLRFFLIASGTAAQAFWGNVTGIEILNSPTSAIATLPGATMSFPDSQSDLAAISVYVYGTDIELSESNIILPLKDDVDKTPLSSEQAYAMVAPSTVANDEFKIKVYTEKNSAGTELTVTLNGTPSAGDSYAITLIFNATAIDFTATLTNWVTDGKAGGGSVE